MSKMIMKEPSFPYQPTEPTIPKEFLTINHYIDLKYSHEYTIVDLLNLLPNGVGMESLRVKNKGWDNGSECGSSVVVYYVTIGLNPNYSNELVSYNKSKDYYVKRLAAWEDDVRAFLKDVDEYLEWAEKEQYIIRRSYFEELREKYSYLR